MEEKKCNFIKLYEYYKCVQTANDFLGIDQETLEGWLQDDRLFSIKFIEIFETLAWENIRWLESFVEYLNHLENGIRVSQELMDRMNMAMNDYVDYIKRKRGDRE